MPRLFVALRLPRALRSAALATMDGVPGARWQSEAQLHCTLAFLGEVDRRGMDDADAALARVSGAWPTLALSGSGSFGRPGRPSSLWLGVPADAALMQVQRSIARSLAMAGLTIDHRAYLPHVTVARLGRVAGPVEPWIVRNSGLKADAHRIGDFTLFESALTSEGAHYEPIGRYELG